MKKVNYKIGDIVWIMADNKHTFMLGRKKNIVSINYGNKDKARKFMYANMLVQLVKCKEKKKVIR